MAQKKMNIILEIIVITVKIVVMIIIRIILKNNNGDNNSNQYIKYRSIVGREFRKGSDLHPFLLLFLFFIVCLFCLLWDFCFTRASVRGTLI